MRSTAPPITRRGACSSTGATRRACAGRAAAAAALADGARPRRGVGRHAPRRRERPRAARSDVLDAGPRARPDRRPRPRPGAAAGSRDRGGTGRTSKRAIELLFWSGEVTSARRRNFERLYDLPERVLPRAVSTRRPRPTEDAQRELVAIAARSLGVAAEPELRDYFRLPAADDPPRVAELVEAGELLPGRGRGLGRAGLPAPRRPHPEAGRRPRAARPVRLRCCGSAAASSGSSASASSSRSTCRPPKRVYGYYVLPFLLGDRLVARVDLKADRQAGGCARTPCTSSPAAPPETEARSARSSSCSPAGSGSASLS